MVAAKFGKSFDRPSTASIDAVSLGKRCRTTCATFVIENRPGAAGNIGTESVVRATPDGYTLLLVGLANAMNATLYKKLKFNFIRDIAPVASIGGTPYVMVIKPRGEIARTLNAYQRPSLRR